MTTTCTMNRILDELRLRIPFLRKIPDRIFYQLDETAFVVPKDKLADDRAKLEKIMKHYVMTYDRNIFDLSTPIESHLCAWIQKAALDEQQLKILHTFEERYIKHGVSFVVYQKPLIFMVPFQSPIASLYRRMTQMTTASTF